MEKKYLNGNLSRNITFGLCWLLSWIPALIVWLVDKDNLDLEDKRELASIIICAIAGTVLSITFIVPLYVGVCGIIACVMAFMGKSFQIPGVYHIAAAIIK
ncbi:MAG: hypothetical protein E7551_06830 [Ruminococcaceae bacterium]|nr:hypothetical protein [Oscillospiraceae bacterium]